MRSPHACVEPGDAYPVADAPLAHALPYCCNPADGLVARNDGHTAWRERRQVGRSGALKLYGNITITTEQLV